MGRINKQSEYLEQVAIFQWRDMNLKKYPELELLHSNLNGVKLTIGQAVKAKRAGALKSLPDLFLPVRKGGYGGYSGLYIELKASGGKPTKQQIEMLEKLELQGFRTMWCEGAKEAIYNIVTYMQL